MHDGEPEAARAHAQSSVTHGACVVFANGPYAMCRERVREGGIEDPDGRQLSETTSRAGRAS